MKLNFIILVFLIYWLLVSYLDKQGILKRYNITAYGPILMLRTQRGQSLLDRLAVHKRIWRIFADIGLPAMLAGMLVMFLLLLFIDYSLIISFKTQSVPPPSKFNQPRNIFLIPGVNEFIPLVWGVIALIITLVVHEFSHAILCKVEGVRVKSMGILFALIPIGGFAEPDEEQLLGKKENNNIDIATRSQRVRILTSGVMANFATAFIAFILFFSLLASLSPVGEVVVKEVIPGYPADKAGVKPNMIITGINGTKIHNAHEFIYYVKTLKPGSNITLSLVDKGVRKNINLITAASNQTTTGVRILKVVKDSPAESAGIKPGMILVRINNTEIKDLKDFMDFMSTTHEAQSVDVYVKSNTSLNASMLVFRNIKLAKYPYKELNKGFLGVSVAPESAMSYSIGISIAQFPATSYLNGLKSIPYMLTKPAGWILLFSLPLFGGPGGDVLTGFTGMFTNFYENAGWASPLGMSIFWILTLLLWVGWMNFYVGLFNCLPAIPLDGGHVFRDVMTSLLSKVMQNGEKVEKLSNTIVMLFAVLILTSLVFVIIAPYAAHGF